MSDKLNENAGKISGKPTIVVEQTGKISGDSSRESKSGYSKNHINQTKIQTVLTRKERIALSTKEKGLETLPQNFGDSDGDWQIIESDNLFEILYLDYSQIISINPDIVQNNFIAIDKFWKEKKNLWESGGGQVHKTIEDKYGAKNLNNCIKKLENACEHLSSVQKINDYYQKFVERKIVIGQNMLEPLFKMMLKDGEAEPTEMENIFEEGVKLDFSDEEIATIIKRTFDSSGYKPFENPTGEDLKAQLLSVSWMTEDKFEEKKKEAEEIRMRGREIFENKFAYSIEDIGTILYSDEGLAKEYIRDELIINTIDYFSVPKAKRTKEIIKDKKLSEHLKYLNIVYFLNPKLPYRFQKKDYSNLKTLTSALFEEEKQGKEHFKQGNIEIWLQETQKDNYQKLDTINRAAKNTDLAFLELLYTFNPELPFRFILYTSNSKLPYGEILVKSQLELCDEIVKNIEGWNLGKRELFNSSILIWLRTIGKLHIVDEWDKVKDQYLEKKDLGLECFLHILNDKLIFPSININVKFFSFPRIQIGESVLTSFVISNRTRGFIEGDITFSKIINGVSLSSKKFALNVTEGTSGNKVDLTIDSKKLLKGVDYKTDIQITTFDNKMIIIPVSFKIVFPQNAFISELLKYSFLFAFFGLILRGIIYAFGFHDWLNAKYNFYLHPFDISWQEKPSIYYFPIILLLFIILVLAFTSFWNLIKRTLNLK